MISSHLWSSLAATRFHDTPSTLAFVGIKGIIVVISALGQNRKAYVERGALFIGWAASRVSGVPWAYRYPWWYQWLPDTVPASAMWGSSAARFFRSHSWRGQLRHAYPTLPSLLRFWGITAQKECQQIIYWQIFNETSNFLNCAVPSLTAAKNLHFVPHLLY